MDNLNNDNVELLQPTVQADSIPIEEKPIEELTTDEIKAIIISKDNALNNYKTTLDSMKEAQAKDIENLNEYYSKKIKEIGNINEELTFDTNIYDLGFDSLSTMELSCIFNCNPQDIYNNPTINKLYLFLNNKNEQIEEKIEINKYIDINKNLTKPFKEKSILLTGATGYLGSHILNELLNIKKTNNSSILGKIYKYFFDS